MAWDTNLLNVKIHEVQEVWTCQQELNTTNHTAKDSQRDVQFFHVVMPNKSPNIMGLKVFTPQKPYVSKVVAPSAPGVGRMARMKA